MKRIATLILATVFCSSYLIDCPRRLSMRQRRSQRRQSRSRRQKSKRLQNQRQSQSYLRATGRAPRPAKYTRRCRLRTYSDTYNIQISADEKTVNWTASRWLGAKFQAATRRNGKTLYWSYEKHDIAGKSTINSSLQLNSDGTATFHETDNIDNGMFKGSGYSVTGRFVRQ